jgi:hypothetical protein
MRPLSRGELRNNLIGRKIFSFVHGRKMFYVFNNLEDVQVVENFMTLEVYRCEHKTSHKFSPSAVSLPLSILFFNKNLFYYYYTYMCA